MRLSFASKISFDAAAVSPASKTSIESAVLFSVLQLIRVKQRLSNIRVAGTLAIRLYDADLISVLYSSINQTKIGIAFASPDKTVKHIVRKLRNRQ